MSSHPPSEPKLSPLLQTQAEAKNSIKAFSTRLSNNTPLHDRLPLEIFLAIIQLCVGPVMTITDLVALQLVCRSWHNIIANASFLWGTINSVEGLPAVRKALQMAKNSPLDITFEEFRSKMHQIDFFNLVGERVNQWRSLVIETEERESAVVELRSRNPQKLEKLHLIVFGDFPSMTEEMILSGGPPAAGLKDLRLTKVPIHLASLQLSGLKALHLEEIPSVPVMEIITIISQSPSLEILHLSRLTDLILPGQSTTGQPNIISDSRIHLPFLATLYLVALPPLFLNLLLPALVVPHLRHITVGCQLDEQPVAQFLTVGMQHLCPSLNLITSHSQTYAVVLSSRGYYNIRIAKLTLTITFDTALSLDHFQETFDWLSSHLDIGLPDLPLHLTLEDCNPDPSLLEWFTLRANVTELSLQRRRSRDIVSKLESIIPFLGRPTSPPSSIWLLPHVQVFRTNLVGSDGSPEIVEMIENRHSATCGPQFPGLDRALPGRFREIWLAFGVMQYRRPPPNHTFLSAVVRVAEGADLYWQGERFTVRNGAHPGTQSVCRAIDNVDSDAKSG
ncbi:hypothetical protein FS837_000693 [Tulasnella sp. UAMH 9824]|nr:hypothetical protein FS837_000693 [Tulasnella sp. UAMH 9824]